MGAIIITGAGGLLGRHLLPLLASSQVVALGRSRTAEMGDNVEFVETDLSRPLDLARLPASVDAVIHLAQSERFREFPEGAPDVFAVNIASVQSLLDYAAARGARHFVNASSGAVYGNQASPLSESAATPPDGDTLNYYGASKRCAELLAMAYSKAMTVANLRYFFIYGPGQASHMLIPRIIGNVAAGRPITLQGEDGLRFNPVHAGDAARATFAALTLDRSAAINVAGPETISLRRLANAAAEALGVTANFETQSGDAPELIADTSQMARLLAEPVRTIDAALPDLLPSYTG